MISQAHINTVKSTIPVLVEHGAAITEHFYQRLFKHHPELQNVFNMSHQRSGEQPKALFNAIAAYATHIETPEALSAVIEHIAYKHITFDVQPAHYSVVGEHLIETLRELLQDAFTPDIEAAWGAAYGFLADQFIQVERGLYQERQKQSGGWVGTRRFTLERKEPESEQITSFYWAASDRQPIMSFKPGQYLAVRVEVPGAPFQAIRQYSLSDRHQEMGYRISVKRESQSPEGMVSCYLHDGVKVGDEVELFAPAGDFYLQNRTKPTVLISAGVGLTPMQSMLEALAIEKAPPNVWYLHQCRNLDQQAFKERNHELKKSMPLVCKTWYSDQKPSAKEALSESFEGHMQLSPLARELPIKEGLFYVCGPQGFMQAQVRQLHSMGVEHDRIFYEHFGPLQAVSD